MCSRLGAGEEGFAREEPGKVCIPAFGIREESFATPPTDSSKSRGRLVSGSLDLSRRISTFWLTVGEELCVTGSPFSTPQSHHLDRWREEAGERREGAPASWTRPHQSGPGHRGHQSCGNFLMIRETPLPSSPLSVAGICTGYYRRDVDLTCALSSHTHLARTHSSPLSSDTRSTALRIPTSTVRNSWFLIMWETTFPLSLFTNDKWLWRSRHNCVFSGLFRRLGGTNMMDWVCLRFALTKINCHWNYKVAHFHHQAHFIFESSYSL